MDANIAAVGSPASADRYFVARAGGAVKGAGMPNPTASPSSNVVEMDGWEQARAVAKAHKQHRVGRNG